MTTETTTPDTPTLTQHARALAAEIGGGPVAASLLAMANECERQGNTAADWAGRWEIEHQNRLAADERASVSLAVALRAVRALLPAWREAEAERETLRQMYETARQERDEARLMEAAWYWQAMQEPVRGVVAAWKRREGERE